MKKNFVRFSLVLSLISLCMPSIEAAERVSQNAASSRFERAKKYARCLFGSSECSKKEIRNARLWAAGGSALFLAAAAAIGIPKYQAYRKVQELGAQEEAAEAAPTHITITPLPASPVYSEEVLKALRLKFKNPESILARSRNVFNEELEHDQSNPIFYQSTPILRLSQPAGWVFKDERSGGYVLYNIHTNQRINVKLTSENPNILFRYKRDNLYSIDPKPDNIPLQTKRLKLR